MVLSHIYRSLSVTVKNPPRAYFFSSPATTATVSSALLAQRQSGMTSIKDIVEDKIAQNKIVVFSKSYCPYCRATKQYFASNYPKEAVEVIELDLRDDGSDIQNYLGVKTGARSVPRTFISGEFVGGNDALQAKPKSEVDALIAKGI